MYIDGFYSVIITTSHFRKSFEQKFSSKFFDICLD